MTKRTQNPTPLFTKVFPIKFVKGKNGKTDKVPLTEHGFKDATADPKQLAEWDRKYPVSNQKFGRGFPTGHRIVVIDVDVKDGKPGLENWARLKQQYGIPDTYSVKTRTGGMHYYYRVSDGTQIKSGTDVLAEGIDIRGLGGYVVCPPTQGYVDTPDVQIADGSGEWVKLLTASPNGHNSQAKHEPTADGNDWADTGSAESGKFTISLVRTDTLRRTVQLLKVLPQEACDNFESWRTVMFAVHHELEEAGWELFDSWSQQSANYDRQRNRQMWDGIKNDKGAQNITIATLIHLAREHGSKITFQSPTRRLKDTKLYTLADALAHSAHIEWVIPGLFSTGTVAVLLGERGTGKTYAAFDLAVCKVLGEQWLGFPLRKSPVLIVDEQSGKDRIAWRLQAVSKARGLTGQEPLYYYTLRRFKFDEEDEEDLKDLMFTILEKDAKLVIIDALRNVTMGDEDKSGDMSKVMEGLRYVADITKSAILLIHHPPKHNARTSRGSGAIEDSADMVISIEGTGGKNKPILKFESTKERDVPPVLFVARKNFSGDVNTGDLTFHLSPEDDSSLGKQGRQYPVGHKFVLQYLLQHEEASVTEMMEAADACPPTTAKKAVYELVNHGLIERANKGRAGRGNPALYALTESGKVVADELEAGVHNPETPTD